MTATTPGTASNSTARKAHDEARKFGTDSPHEPTDEFVRHAFAEGARYVWPDGRDPGWHVTFDRYLAARIEQARAEGAAEGAAEVVARVEALADWYDAQINWREWGIGSNIRATLRGQK